MLFPFNTAYIIFAKNYEEQKNNNNQMRVDLAYRGFRINYTQLHTTGSIIYKSWSINCKFVVDFFLNVNKLSLFGFFSLSILCSIDLTSYQISQLQIHGKYPIDFDYAENFMQNAANSLHILLRWTQKLDFVCGRRDRKSEYLVLISD